MSTVNGLSFCNTVKHVKANRKRSRGVNCRSDRTQHKAQQNPQCLCTISLSFFSTALPLPLLRQIRSTKCQSSTASCHTVIVQLLYACVNVQSNATSLHTFKCSHVQGNNRRGGKKRSAGNAKDKEGRGGHKEVRRDRYE